MLSRRNRMVLDAARTAQRLLTAATAEERGGRNGLLPAAVRVERTRAAGRRGEHSEQTALTLWFGEGPSLPSAAGAARVRLVAGTAIALAGAAALGAATYFANQREAQRLPSRVDVPRLEA